MTSEKIPKNDLMPSAQSVPFTLRQAAKLLSDRNDLIRLVKEGQYKAIGNRLVTFIREMQQFRGKEILEDSDRQGVEQGIERIFNIPGLSDQEKPHLLQTIKAQFVRKGISPEYLSRLNVPEIEE